MRPDMGRIAVDAYRHHDNDAQFSQKHQKHRGRLDERPTKESMARSRNGSKALGENLSPLYRWLKKQVGRRWDDIYSEIVTTLGGGYANLEHIKGHVLQKVERGEICMIDGYPHHRPLYFWRDDGWRELARNELYVDERGIMRYPPKNVVAPSERRSRDVSKRPPLVMLDALTVAAKIDGTWFISELRSIPEHEVKVVDYTRYSYKNPDRVFFKKEMVKQSVKDIMLDHLNRRRIDGRWSYPNIPWDERARIPYDTRNLYAPSIRTMSKKEIKQRIPESMR